MITDLVSNGCSYVWGDELDNRENRFVNLIAKKFNATLHDKSQSGNNNQLIYSDVIDKVLDLIHNKKIPNENILVIVNWSFIERITYYESNYDQIFPFFSNYFETKHHHPLYITQTKNGQWVFDEDKYKFFKKWYYDHFHINYMKYNTLFLIYGLINFLKLNNIKYVFSFADCDIFWDILNEKNDPVDDKRSYRRTSIQNIVKTIDQTYFYKDKNISKYYWFGFELAPKGHPKDEAHVVFADRLFQFIKESYPDV